MSRLIFSLCLMVGVAGLLFAPALAATESGASATSAATQANPMTVVLDARLAPRGLMVSHLTIPVKSGPATIVYPKWIPGEHGPTGPLSDLVAIRMSADGHAIAWHRDKINFYAFHVDVPPGASSLAVDFDVALNGAGDVMATKNIAIVNWNRDVLYQADTNSHQVFVKPSVILPHGWSYGTALPDPRQSGDRIDFGEVALNMLIDSPLDMGRFYKHYKLWQQGSAVQMLDIFADKPQDLDIDAKTIAEYKRMPAEAFALYGGRHWDVYHSLLTLSDAIGFQGIEHHQSSDDRSPDDFLTNPAQALRGGDLVTHEYSHSWNGKYRRPDDLTTPNFQIPEQTDLLWVYEGMNQYLGDLLSFRIGVRAPKLYPEYLANIYAEMDTEPGRATTPIIDLTTSAPYLYQAGGQYSSLRRTAGDFYTEGELIWLDADTIIREGTGGKKSLDDFEHLFAGGVSGPITVTYTRAQVEHLLGEVYPYDWNGFFERYVYQVSAHPPTDMLARSGYALVYTSKPNTFITAASATRHSVIDWYSLGVNFSGKGAVVDVRKNSPAWNAGLAPGMMVVAVDQQEWSGDALEYAMKEAQHSKAPTELLVNHSGYFGTYRIDYHGGLKYPHLVRIKSKPDMLIKIMSPHAR
ncbi:MAG: M61 family peptidase [Candidatus Eremiobacteraeota bacterium]|nr:M61 family peptidase [Candidatus Eremiobacteraeota bacterium]